MQDSDLAADPWESLPEGSAGSLGTPLPSTPLSGPATGRRGNGGKLLALLGGLAGLLCVVGLGGWLVWSMWPSDASAIQDNFVPVTRLQDHSNSDDPLLRAGEEFSRFARDRDVPGALGLVDRDLFQQRLMSPDGSYVAQVFQIDAGKLLSEASKYALENTTTHGGKRLWQVVGTSEFAGKPGVVLRYFSEPRAAFELFEDPELWRPIAELVTFEEFTQAAKDLFTFPKYKELKSGGLAEYRSEISRDQAVPWSTGILPPRVGYVMLVLDSASGQPKICDLVNVLGQQPLSRSCGPMYAIGWTMFRGTGEALPGVEKLTRSYFGDRPQRITTRTQGDSEEDWLLPNGRHRNRSVRLEEIAAAVASPGVATDSSGGPRNDRLKQLIQAFHEDFPGDVGAELTVVITTMMPNEPRLYEANMEQISVAASVLHERFADPFLDHVLGLIAWRQGNVEVARKHFNAAIEGGFESVELHEFFIADATQRQDKAALLDALAALNRFWANPGQPQNEKLHEKFAGRWKSVEQAAQPPEPTLADAMRNQRGPNRGRPPYGGGPGRRGPMGRGGRSPVQPDDVGRPGGERPGTGGRPSGPRFTGPTVVLALSFAPGFDTRAAITALREKLGVQTYSMRGGGNQATVELDFAGPLEEVVKAIDFGEVTGVDHDVRKITIQVNN